MPTKRMHQSVSAETDASRSSGPQASGRHGRVSVEMRLLEKILAVDKALTHKRVPKRVGVKTYAKSYIPEGMDFMDVSKFDPDDRQRVWREVRQGEFKRRHASGDFPLLDSDPTSPIHLKFPSNFSQLDSEQNLKPLRLPPIFLPPVYTVKPAPLQPRFFLTPTYPRGPITDEEWEELKECRYLRSGLKKYKRRRVES